MNTEANAMPESNATSAAIAPAAIPPSRRMYWLVRRELWESRSIYIAPLAVAAVLLFGFFLSSFAGIWERSLRLHPAQKLVDPYSFAELMIMGAAFLTALFYCQDALHGERRDRSILFWKSLPVSDLESVLSKAIIPIFVIPLLSFAITVVTQWLMLLWSSAVVLVSGGNVSQLWQVSLIDRTLGLFYHLVAIHGLWYAPIYAWLLAVSAWARRAPILWAALPIAAVGIVERVTLNTSQFTTLLLSRLSGGSEGATYQAGMSGNPQAHFHTGHFLFSPGLWVGLVFAAIFLAAAARLRRSQGPL